jgi:branched-chain amino acid transport system ATP-binding protein
MALLKVENLSKSFSGLKAVSNLEMEINDGELVGLIGPNGAGKTTAFNLLTGFMSPPREQLFFKVRKSTASPL